MRRIDADCAMRRRTEQFGVVLRDHAVVEDRRVSGRLELAVFEARPVEDDVVYLPFARFARSIHERRRLPVDRGGLAIRIRRVLEGIEHLNFVAAVEEDAAIAAALAIAYGRWRR